MGVQRGALGCSGTKPAAAKAVYNGPWLTIVDESRPKHSEIRGANSISDA